jgi:hypothetical protein
MFKRIREQLSALFASDSKPPNPTPTSAAAPPPPQLVAPFEILRVSGTAVPSTWSTLRKRPGIVPVLLGDRESTGRVLELPQLNQHSFESIRDTGLGLDLEEWMAERLREEPERFQVDDTTTGPVSPISPFSPAYDIRTGTPLPEVFIGLIPVAEPWLVPAYLKMGGWNDCPDATVQLGFFKRWFDRYGAVVTTMADDVIEFNVSRPPTTAEAARQLAMEQYVYCTDIVDQGVETLGNLAAALRGSPNWYFWWD